MTRTLGLHRTRARTRALFVAATLTTGVLCGSALESVLAAPAGSLARDEEFVLRLGGAAKLSKINDGGITVKVPANSTVPDPVGKFVAGRAIVDASNQRAVVVRPEAVREFFELVKGLPREDATRAAERLLTKVERTGKFSLLASIDRDLKLAIGLTNGVRLDDPGVFGAYPSQLNDTTFDNDDPLTLDMGDSPLEPYRTRIAGDDELWHRYIIEGDINGFTPLSQNSEFERFFHPVDFDTGVRAANSVLRQREHRRVLMRPSNNLVTFVPAIPNRADLTDAGFAAGARYDVRANGSLRRLAKALLPARGGTTSFVNGLASFTVEPDTGDGGHFLGGIPFTTAQEIAPVRVYNQTPPNGESEVDPTTDWEDPDNQFTVPLPQRRPMVVRLRFSRPLDPRTVDAASITLRKIAQISAGGVETPVNLTVAASVTLHQSRLGEILVELHPQVTLDPSSKYETTVRNTVKGLDGSENPFNNVSTFITR